MNVDEPRRIKPDPKDPEWTFPFASRQRIENLERYFASLGQKNTAFGSGRKLKPVLPANRPNKIPWESVPPQYRFRCQQLFNRKIAEERAKKIPGWPTRGKIDSLRMNVTNAGRHMFNGEYWVRYFHYKRNKKMWLLWLDWCAKEQREKAVAERGPEAHAQLEVG
jgi:hypothetical protein